jgi:hypothetical protein
MERSANGGFFITGQVAGALAAHTGSDVPLSAFGAGAGRFGGVMDNTDVFFSMMQCAIGGTGANESAPRDARPGLTAAVPGSGSPGQRTAADRVINLSSRGLVGTGADAMFNGFVLAGTQPHRLLIRGVGPALSGLGVGKPLLDPVLRVQDSTGALVAANDNWESNDNVMALREATSTVGAFALGPGAKDAALLIDLPPGSYTVQLSGADGETGLGLLEIYELP